MSRNPVGLYDLLTAIALPYLLVITKLHIEEFSFLEYNGCSFNGQHGVMSQKT
jgi:hypothetical protein